MTVFDYVFLAVLGLSAMLGLWRGAVSEILGLAGWVLALIVAGQYVDVAAPRFVNTIVDPRWRVVASFALVLFAVLLLMSLVKFFLRHLLYAVGLGATDRFLGAVFGVIRGLVIALAVVWIGGLIGMSREPWWKQALFAPPLENAMEKVRAWLPEIDIDLANKDIRFK
ncbi:MAG: CvpA family protein [Betaproteobacteria bacterium]|nr:CvpA family protein [Betaproteobacteria bacterium]